jgi:hypothetical protein
MPWGDSKKWKLGNWYPSPVGFFSRDYNGYIIEGYDIFELSPCRGGALLGDIIPAGPDVPSMPFSLALQICEIHNGEKLL